MVEPTLDERVSIIVAKILEVCRDDATYTAELPRVLKFGAKCTFKVIKVPVRKSGNESSSVRNFQLIGNNDEVVATTLKDLRMNVHAFLQRQFATGDADDAPAAPVSRRREQPKRASRAAVVRAHSGADDGGGEQEAAEDADDDTAEYSAEEADAAAEAADEESPMKRQRSTNAVIERMQAAMDAHDYNADARKHWIESKFNEMRKVDKAMPVALLVKQLEALADSHRDEWESKMRVDDEKLMAEYKDVLGRVSARVFALESEAAEVAAAQ